MCVNLVSVNQILHFSLKVLVADDDYDDSDSDEDERIIITHCILYIPLVASLFPLSLTSLISSHGYVFMCTITQSNASCI